MKKLKIILPLLLISLFFIPNVRALSSDYYYEPKNTDALQSLIDNNLDKIEAIKDYLENNGMTYNNTTYYPNDNNYDWVLAIQMNNINSTFQVRMINYTSYVANNNLSGITSYWAKNQYSNPASGGGVLTWPQTMYYQSFQFVNGVVTPTNNANLTGSSFGWNNISGDICDPREATCIIENSNWYFDTEYMKNNRYFYINTNGCSGVPGICLDVPLLLSNNGNEVKVAGEYVNIKDFIDNLQIKKFTCDLEYLGNFTNVNSVTFRVQGTTNALAEPLQGNVVLTSLGLDWNNFNGNISDIVVQTNEGPNFEEYLAEHHEISYSNGQLLFYYEVTSEDDIDTYIDILYTITYDNLNWEDFFENNVEIRACQPYHGTFTYAYRNKLTGVTSSTDNILMNFLNNGSPPDDKPLFDYIKNYPAGPIDSILTMPLELLRSLVNKLNTNTCVPLNLPLPFTGGTLILPCLNTIYSQIGGLNTFLTWFSGIFSAFLIYKYLIFLYKWVDDTLTLRENNHFGGY